MTDTERGEESEGETAMTDQEEVEKRQRTRDWEAVMGEAERLAFDDP